MTVSCCGGGFKLITLAPAGAPWEAAGGAWIVAPIEGIYAGGVVSGSRLWSRRGVGGCRTWGLVGWGPSGLSCREIGCGESRWRGLGARRSHLIQERLHALDARGERPNRLRDRVDPLGQGFSALTAPAELVLHLSELAEALGDSWGVVHGPCTVGPGLHPVVQLALRRPNAILKIAYHAMDSRQRSIHGLMSASTLPDVVGEVAG